MMDAAPPPLPPQPQPRNKTPDHELHPRHRYPTGGAPGVVVVGPHQPPSLGHVCILPDPGHEIVRPKPRRFDFLFLSHFNFVVNFVQLKLLKKIIINFA